MKWLVTWAIVLLALLYPMMTNSGSIEEPSIEEYQGWAAHRSLGVILVYQIEGRQVEFAHPVVALSAAPECSPVQLNGSVWRVLVLGPNPMRYQIRAYATAYRYPPGEWVSVLERTYYEKGSQGQAEAKTQAQAE